MSNHKFKHIVGQGLDYDKLCCGDYGTPSCRAVSITDWEQAEQKQTAHMICSECPCRTECLRIALALEISSAASWRFGCWGGLYPTQRYQIYYRWLKNHQTINQLIKEKQ